MTSGVGCDEIGWLRRDRKSLAPPFIIMVIQVKHLCPCTSIGERDDVLSFFLFPKLLSTKIHILCDNALMIVLPQAILVQVLGSGTWKGRSPVTMSTCDRLFE